MLGAVGTDVTPDVCRDSFLAVSASPLTGFEDATLSATIVHSVYGYSYKDEVRSKVAVPVAKLISIAPPSPTIFASTAVISSRTTITISGSGFDLSQFEAGNAWNVSGTSMSPKWDTQVYFSTASTTPGTSSRPPMATQVDLQMGSKIAATNWL